MSNHHEYCHNCGVAINEPSAFCSRCGVALAEPESDPAGPVAETPAPTQMSSPGAEAPRSAQRPTSSRKWIPFTAVGGGAILLAGVVAVVLVALGGSAGNNVKSTSVTRAQALQLLAANGTTTVSRMAAGLFAVVGIPKLDALVPAGWRATAQAAGATTRAEFADPSHPGSTLTIVLQMGGAGNDQERALAARRAATRNGYVESSFGRIALPGGREAWHLRYTKSAITHETYFYSGCAGRYALVVDVSATSSSFPQELATLQAAAAGAEPLC